MNQVFVLCIILGVISVQAFPLENGIPELKNRINTVNISLIGILESIPSSNMSTIDSYEVQKQSVRTLGTEANTAMQKKVAIAQKTGKYIEPCLKINKNGINDARQQAFSNLKKCVASRLEAVTNIREKIEATALVGTQLVNDIETIEAKCAKGPINFDTFCIAEKLPAVMDVVTNYEVTVVKVKKDIASYLVLSSDEELNSCFQKAQLIFSEDLENADIEFDMCINSA